MSQPPNSQLPANWVPRPPSPPPPLPKRPISEAQWGLIGFTLLLFLCSISLRIIYQHKLETTAVMFVGLPAALAILLSLIPRSDSVFVSAMKGTTIGLMLSAVVFGEGVICVLMAAPIAYIVAAGVGLAADSTRKTRNPAAQCVIWLAVAAMSFEGSSKSLSLSRMEEVSVQRTVLASPAEVEATLTAAPAFHTQLPLYFRMGFPKPVSAQGGGLQPGDRRVIHFAGGEGHPGDEVFEISARTQDSVTFQPLQDTSHIAHWLRWQQSVVMWRAVDPQHTQITWTLRYTRGLDPAWYFRPSERYAARLAAGYLIDNLATPRNSGGAN